MTRGLALLGKALKLSLKNPQAYAIVPPLAVGLNLTRARSEIFDSELLNSIDPDVFPDITSFCQKPNHKKSFTEILLFDVLDATILIMQLIAHPICFQSKVRRTSFALNRLVDVYYNIETAEPDCIKCRSCSKAFLGRQLHILDLIPEIRACASLAKKINTRRIERQTLEELLSRDEGMCHICYKTDDAVEFAILPTCGHSFCVDCTRVWFEPK